MAMQDDEYDDYNDEEEYETSMSIHFVQNIVFIKSHERYIV